MGVLLIMRAANSFRFYFSFRSPFAAIAIYRLRRAAQFGDFQIELIPVWPENIFGGHMDNPTDNLFKMAYLFVDAARQADDAGINAGFFRTLAKNFTLKNDVDYAPEKLGIQMPNENWGLTHHAFNYAQEQGRGWAFADAVCIRRFNFDGQGPQDVLNPKVLQAIASQVGIDPDKAINAQSSGLYDERQAAFIKSSEADGVFGVPFFAIDRDVGAEVFWGNDRLGFLLKSLTDVESMPVIPQVDATAIQTTRR
jgi:2-hydroxychromene-2-carboxylate isomerase|tara:strand:+ start:5167 stop:5925 length:759 start_codon:yes stop_codon:yes gene_type:complete